MDPHLRNNFIVHLSLVYSASCFENMFIEATFTTYLRQPLVRRGGINLRSSARSATGGIDQVLFQRSCCLLHFLKRFETHCLKIQHEFFRSIGKKKQEDVMKSGQIRTAKVLLKIRNLILKLE